MAALFIALLLFPYVSFVWAALYSSCRKIDLCSCELDDGKVVSLHRAAGASDGKPLFVFKANTTLYTFSPCSAKPCRYNAAAESIMDDTVICLEPNTSIASASTSVFQAASNGIILLYSGSHAAGATTSQVHLTCSKEEQFVLTKNTSDAYFFTLYTACACPGTCVDTVHNISPGTILIFIFFSFCLLYFGIGCIYKRTLRGATGSEMLPHRDFWCSLPGLIRDGYLFFISPCLGSRAVYEAYNKL